MQELSVETLHATSIQGIFKKDKAQKKHPVECGVFFILIEGSYT